MLHVGVGRIAYPGVETPLSCQFTLGHGCRPSQGTLEFAAQTKIVPARGTLSLSCDGNAVAFANCLIDAATYEVGGQGRTVTVRILDRRVDWRMAYISGEYNLRRADDSIEPDTERTPQELALLLCREFGEAMDVSALPNDSRPYVVWDNNLAADELDSLCDSLNCRVVLLRSNQSRIVRLNTGEPLPGGDLRHYVASSVDPVEKPDILRLAGNLVKRQVRLKLEPWGFDIDGKWKHIDDLMYRPPDGWEHEWPDILSSISDKKITLPDGSKSSPRDLYLSTVFRCYRVEEISKIPDLSKRHTDLNDFVKRFQLLPLGNELGEEWTDPDGRKFPRAAYCTGDWYGYTTGDATVDTIQNNVGLRVPYPFSVDGELGIVQFHAPLYRMGGDDAPGTVKPAKLWLYVAVEVKHPITRAPERYYKDLRLTFGNGRRVLQVPHDDITLLYRALYDDKGDVATNPDNLADCDQKADYYLATALQQFADFPADEAPYSGLTLADVDGAIQQITWSVIQGQGAATQISRGGEHNLNVPGYKQRQEDRNRVKVEMLVRKAAAEDRRKRKKG